MSKIPTYTTSAVEGDPQLDYVFSDGNHVTVLLGGPEPYALYMNEGEGSSYLGDLRELDSMKSKALHTTHTIKCWNLEDGSPFYETYTINESIPPRFEEFND